MRDPCLSGENLKPAAAADFLGLAPRTLANWRWLRKGPAYVKNPGVNGAIRYPREALDAWRAQNLRVIDGGHNGR